MQISIILFILFYYIIYIVFYGNSNDFISLFIVLYNIVNLWDLKPLAQLTDE